MNMRIFCIVIIIYVESNSPCDFYTAKLVWQRFQPVNERKMVIHIKNHSYDPDPLVIFEQKARIIYRLACKHGTVHSLLGSDGKPSRESFLRACHNGFAEAQELIIVELLLVQKALKQLKHDLKSARSQRDKIATTKIHQEIEIENFKECILRKLADSIAWHIIGGQNYIARRLCLLTNSRPSLESSNLPSVIQVANDYNKENPLNFALVSDITSFIQIGDVLLVSPTGLKIIEVKEGQKNLEASSLLAELRDDATCEQQLRELNLKDNLREQMQRMLRQQNRQDQVINLLNTGVGKDAATGSAVAIVDVEYPEERYYDELRKLLCQLGAGKDWAYTVIDTGLHIGVYQGQWREFGANLLRASAFDFEDADENYPVTSLRESLNQALVEPLFVKDLAEDQIFDIAFGRVSVLALLRVDHMLHLFEEMGVSAQLLPPKRSRREQDKDSKHKLLIHQGCCIEVKTASGTKILGDGIGTRILYDTMTPRCVVRMVVGDISDSA
jgi:hypothetical protein